MELRDHIEIRGRGICGEYEYCVVELMCGSIGVWNALVPVKPDNKRGWMYVNFSMGGNNVFHMWRRKIARKAREPKPRGRFDLARIARDLAMDSKIMPETTFSG